MSFVHLHVHSTHSPKDGFTSVEEYFQKAEELGMPGLAITDHGVISAVPEIIEAAKRHPTVKPIIGCEAYITDHYKCFHVVLLAKNEAGFRNLCALCAIAKAKGSRFDRPKISHELLEKHHEGLICTSACIGGEIPSLFLESGRTPAREALSWYRDIFGEDFYLEVSAHYSDIPGYKNELYTKQKNANAFLFEEGKDENIMVVATNDVHFLSREDGPSQDSAMCEKMRMQIDDPDRIRFTQQEYFKTEEEMLAIFPDHAEAVGNTMEILNKVETYDLDSFLECYKKTEDLIVKLRVEASKQKHSETILGKMDKVVSTIISKDSNHNTHLEEQRIYEVEEELRFLAEKFGISQTQAMLFCLMFDKTGFDNCDMQEFAEYLGVSTMKAYSYDDDYEVLRKKWLIRMSPSGEFRIPRMVIHDIKRGKVFEKPDFKNLDTASLVYQIDTFIDYVDQREYSVGEAVEDTKQAISENPKSCLAKFYEKYELSKTLYDDQYLFLLLLCARLVDGKDSVATNLLILKFKENNCGALRNRILGGCLKLQKKGIIIFDSCDGMVTKDKIKISEDALTEICEDAQALLEDNSPSTGIIMPCNIAKKELFFDGDVESNMSTLSGLLEDTKYNELKRSLRECGMREGFTCLFYGAPGTGKTESVYQLAKESGRDLLEVDVANLMDCFVGESEKNTRRVFENYRRAAKGNKRTPILLFNEADAILGKRMKGAERAVDRMSNSVQNIILQEMEKLDGIMIATTNLTENLDPAFERRFLYKIKFENPTKELRSKIWKEMIPSLKEEEAISLSESYNFSGGQIENIARKRTIAGLLSGKEVAFDQIQTFCSEELLQNKENTKIGFNS